MFHHVCVSVCVASLSCGSLVSGDAIAFSLSPLLSSDVPSSVCRFVAVWRGGEEFTAVGDCGRVFSLYPGPLARFDWAVLVSRVRNTFRLCACCLLFYSRGFYDCGGVYCSFLYRQCIFSGIFSFLFRPFPSTLFPTVLFLLPCSSSRVFFFFCFFLLGSFLLLLQSFFFIFFFSLSSSSSSSSSSFLFCSLLLFLLFFVFLLFFSSSFRTNRFCCLFFFFPISFIFSSCSSWILFFLKISF